MNRKDLTILEAYLIWAGTHPDRTRARMAAWEVYTAVRDGRAIPERDDLIRTHRDLGREETSPREATFPTSPYRKVVH